MPFPMFDRRRLRLLPLREREHDLDRGVLQFPESERAPFSHPALAPLGERIRRSRRHDRAVIFACGAHVLRTGNGPLLIDLMRRGLITQLALNGAGAIHDFELAMIGATCESVAKYVRRGQFGLWHETGLLNEASGLAADEEIGLGEAIGRQIEEKEFPYRETSVLAAGVRYQVPVTVHVAFGQDIVHEHPDFDPAATGAATYRDFLIFTESVTRLEGGVFLNLGTAVMGPEVFLKAIAMARNVAHQEGKTITDLTTAVFDLLPLDDTFSEPGRATEVPEKSDPRYYFRPYKTVLVRTVADGGSSYYVQGNHRRTIPALYDCIVSQETA
jgi:hypothetical protein